MRSVILLTVALVLALSACVGSPSRPAQFYDLAVEDTAPLPGADGFSQTIGLGPITLPGVLDRPQIVTRASAHEVTLSEFHRWGGDLAGILNRTLTQNLMNLLGTQRVTPFPWPSREGPDRQLAVDFFRLDGELGGHAVLEGLWRIRDPQSGAECRAQRFRLERPVAETDYRAFVSALSRGLGELSRQMAQGLLATAEAC
jgi:uncharacterized lipoprotein YmbA